MCVRARKVILPGLSRNGPTGLLITSLILMTDCSENTFCFKIYRHSVSVFFFFRSTELHEVNNYDTNFSTEHAYQLRGMARYLISSALRQITMAN